MATLTTSDKDINCAQLSETHYTTPTRHTPAKKTDRGKPMDKEEPQIHASTESHVPPSTPQNVDPIYHRYVPMPLTHLSLFSPSPTGDEEIHQGHTRKTSGSPQEEPSFIAYIQYYMVITLHVLPERFTHTSNIQGGSNMTGNICV